MLPVSITHNQTNKTNKPVQQQLFCNEMSGKRQRHDQLRTQRVSSSKKNLAKTCVVEFIEERFDVERPIDLAKDVCALCNQGHDFGVIMQRIIPNISDIGNDRIYDDDDDDDDDKDDQKVDIDGGSAHSSTTNDINNVWISTNSCISGKRRQFVHFFCALLSPQTWFTGDKWHNVTKEIYRGRSLTCSFCKQRGATLGCCEPSCCVVMHIPCAIKNGFEFYRYRSEFYCEGHVKSKKKQQKAGYESNDSFDVSLGKEALPVSVDDRLSWKSFRELGFQYVTMNIDSDEVISNSCNVDGLNCCDCQDLCDDIAQCSCLQTAGRNYSYEGIFINEFTDRILECNMKCNCSIR
jgi:hypothetical protein